MRDNGPVTQREVVMRDDMIIVSKTDDKGRIQFINQDFLEIAGFTKEELMGQPHNIIRHPDMPPEAFEDMWRDLKSGKPWNGLVKNRVKNGNHYWVNANAMPVTENGKITGYISIRSKPDAAAVKAAEQIYRQFLNRTSKSLSIVHGRVISAERTAKFSRWWEKLGTRIIAMGTALALMIMILGGVGVFVADRSTESLRTVYEDRTVPAGQLADINSLLYSTMLHFGLIAAGQEEAAPLITEIEEAIPAMQKIWEAYMATYLTPEEKILAQRYNEENTEYLQKGVLPALALAKDGKNEELAVFLLSAHQLFDKAATTNDALIALQMDVAGNEYLKSKKEATFGFWLTIGVIIAGTALAWIASRKMQNLLSSRLDYVDSRLSSISGGNYATDIQPGNDELHNILSTIRALQATLLYADMEKKQIAYEARETQMQLANQFEANVKSIVNVVATAATELSQSAEAMVGTAQNSSAKAQDATGAAASTTSNVQTVASAAEELSASVREISGQLQKTNHLVHDSREKAHNADGLANKLTVATNKVAEAMEMISGIAGQINLLALNATIESARAGEAGKGFAVVASEVKNLAGQTDKTIADIHKVTSEMREASQSIISALAEIGVSVSSIAEATSSVASAVEEQSATTNEIAKSMQTAAASTNTISHNLEEVQAASSQAGSASEQMLMASRELSQQAEHLNQKVDEFLTRIRAI